ncbi:MAG: sporulation integral membrane protein YtvI [Acutalibacteraceae bacterium]
MDIEKKRKTIINIVYYAMIIGIFYLLLKYAFWLFFPIVIAFAFALILQKPTNAIARKTPIKKGIASVICVFLLLFIVVGLIALIGASAVNYLKGFAEYIKGLFGSAEELIENLKTWLITTAGKLPQSLSKILIQNINDIFMKLDPSSNAAAQSAAQSAADAAQSSGGLSLDLSKITSWLSTPLTSVVSTAMQIPTMLLNVLITIIMTCFLTADFDKVTSFLTAQLSEKRQKDFQRAKYLLKTSFLKILRAYGLIILITFTEMLIGLTVLKLIGVFNSNYIFIVAAVTAVVDILPVLGTGTVIFPWAAYCVITGSYGLAIGLIIIYAVMAVIRQIIEPKLVAGQLGLPPFMTIIGMFLGLKLFGFVGMLIMPILIIMLKLLNDEGIIHMWKSPEPAEVTVSQEETANASQEQEAEADTPSEEASESEETPKDE